MDTLTMTTAKERAYDVLKSRILSGELESGFQLKELELADELGVSRTPARQAIKRLASQGLVVIKENRRSYVAEYSAEQFAQVFDVLVFLEGYSAALAAERVTGEQIEHMRQLNAEMAKCDTNEKSGRSRFLALNTEFHAAIHKASGNDRICEMIVSLIEFTRFLFVKHGQIDTAASAAAIRQHDDIIAALEHRNPELVRLQMQLHRESVRQGFSSLWKAVEYDQRNN